MAPNKKYLSLEEAAGELGLRPEELIRLREKGAVRGFADRGTWKFKADDIAEYHRSQQPDSEPDIPILADFDDEAPQRKDNVIRHGLDENSDSDVRLVLADEPRKSRLSGSSAEVMAMDLQKSDSDVRLVESPKDVKNKLSGKGSDSDVKIVKPKVEAESDSDSDVKMINKPMLKSDSDSDVKLAETQKRTKDSDSDVRMASSDSDVRLAPLADSDSDVKLVGRATPSSEIDSDSDVKLLSPKSGKQTPGDLPLMPVDFSVEKGDDESPFLLDPNDSGVQLSGDRGTRVLHDSAVKRDSGIKVDRDSGITLAGDSGIRLAGDSGIRLQDDSGIQLIRPADSGISLEGKDSGVRFPDSGITLGADSGIALGGDSGIRLGDSSGKNVKGGSGKKRKGDSGKKLMSDNEDIDATSPMLVPDSDELPGDFSGEVSGEYSTSDTSEMQAFSESDHNVVLFEDDEEDDAVIESPKKRSKKKAGDSDISESEDMFDELEVADEDLSDDGDFGDLDFDSQDDALGDSYSEGSSQLDILTPKKIEAAKEVEWGAGFCGLLFVSICVLIVGSIVSADLLRVVWANGFDSNVDPGMAWLLAGLWK